MRWRPKKTANAATNQSAIGTPTIPEDEWPAMPIASSKIARNSAIARTSGATSHGHGNCARRNSAVEARQTLPTAATTPSSARLSGRS